MYEVSRECSFSAAHQLRGYGGKCESLHGHNWRVRVSARAKELDHLGMVVDFKLLKSSLGEVLEQLDHQMLNQIPPFDRINPSAENIARWIAEQLDRAVSDERVRVHRCEVWESECSRATYFISDP
jgi:6-pyruvoyltetrahydropterin/6-carboxytetrahydropterin synthase